MPFLTKKINWKLILIFLTLGISMSVACLWFFKDIFIKELPIKIIKPKEKYCTRDADCVLHYIGPPICPSCAINEYDCVSLDYYNKVLWPKWKKKYPRIVCEGCPMINEIILCICEKNLCKKIIKDDIYKK